MSEVGFFRPSWLSELVVNILPSLLLSDFDAVN